jgi:hypothetical protein
VRSYASVKLLLILSHTRCLDVQTLLLHTLLQYLVGDVVGAVTSAREVIGLFERTPGAMRWM